MGATALTNYPWHALDSVSKRTLRALEYARPMMERGFRITELAGSIGTLLGGEVTLLVRDIRAEQKWPLPMLIWLELVDGGTVGLNLDPDLVSLAVSRALQRPVKWSRPDVELDATLRGALGALVVEAARRSGHTLPFRVAYDPPSDAASEVAPPLRVAATLLLDERPYAVDATLCSSFSVSRERTLEPAHRALERLGSMELRLPVVAAVSLATRAALEAMGPGDAWLPGRGWWIENDMCGRAALVAPRADRGTVVQLTSDGSIVLSGKAVELAHDTDAARVTGAGITMQPEKEPEAEEQLIQQTALDAPIVVRVELGAVAMTAREWAELAPGDVIETGRRVAEPVILRVAGQEVAQGELVNVEGELGVRIRKLSRRS